MSTEFAVRCLGNAGGNNTLSRRARLWFCCSRGVST